MSILYGSLDNLRPKFSRKFADRVGFEQSKPAGPVLLPHLQRVFLLVDADERIGATRSMLRVSIWRSVGIRTEPVLTFFQAKDTDCFKQT